MSIYEIDTGGVERIRGTLHTTGGAPGDVPVQQADGQLLQAPGGGSTPTYASYSGASATTIANGTGAELSWDTLNDGQDLFDRTDPLNPVVLADGVYAFTGYILLVDGPLTAGGCAQADLSVGDAEAHSTIPGGITATHFTLDAGVSATTILSQGDTVGVLVRNDDGVASHDFKLGIIYVVKIG